MAECPPFSSHESTAGSVRKVAVLNALNFCSSFQPSIMEIDPEKVEQGRAAEAVWQQVEAEEVGEKGWGASGGGRAPW